MKTQFGQTLLCPFFLIPVGVYACVWEREKGKKRERRSLLAGRIDEGLIKRLTLILFPIKCLPGLLIFEPIEIPNFFRKLLNACKNSSKGGTWGAQWGKCLPPAQVMILGDWNGAHMGLPALWGWGGSCFSLCPHPPAHALSLSRK